METTRLRLLTGLASVLSVALAIFALAGETPGSDVSGSELASFYGDSWRKFIAAFVLAALRFAEPGTAELRRAGLAGVAARARADPEPVHARGCSS